MPQDGILGAENMDYAQADSSALWEGKADKFIIILKK